LSPHAAGFRAFLDRQGYCSQQTGLQLGLMTQLSRWLAGQEIGAEDFTGQVVDQFAGVMRATRRSLISQRALAPLLTYLRELAVVPAGPPADHTPHGIVVGSYRDYLRGGRGLAEGTVSGHLRFARAFLAELDDPLDESLAALSAGQVLAIVARQVRERRSVSSAKNLASSVRTLLRFLFGRGYVGADLAPVVLRVAPWRLTSAPGRLETGAAQALLASCDRSARKGLRDYAILLILARLGLRASEAATLTLDDIDWAAGEITIRGKGHRLGKLPLVWDCGEAIADYLHAGRPTCASRAVFITIHAPLGALSSQAVGQVVAYACARAGLAPFGPHRLRHTLASDLLAAGAPLSEIGQVLRHQDPITTAHYARTDRAALTALIRPWPSHQEETL